MYRVVVGDRVRIQYVRALVGDSAPTKAPRRVQLEFIAGSSEVSAAISSAVVGMAPGDHKCLKLLPHEAYGEIRAKLIRQIPRARFPRNMQLEVGKPVTLSYRASGKKRRAVILEVQLESVLVDGNHPLAGKEIVLDIELIALASISAAEAATEINEKDAVKEAESTEHLEA